jgi:hypothetical protein
MVAPPPSIPSGEEQQGGWIEVKKPNGKKSTTPRGDCEEKDNFSSENPKAMFTLGSKGSGPVERETAGQLQTGTFLTEMSL